MTVTIIHPLQQDRWSQYRDLRLHALQECPQAFLDTFEEARGFDEDRWKQKLENMFFAEHADTLVGMIGCYRDERSKIAHILNVVSFFVRKDYRGNGIGRQLLKTVEQHASGLQDVKKLSLGAITTQHSAIALYKHAGFEVVGMTKMSVKVGDTYYDELLMEKYLE